MTPATGVGSGFFARCEVPPEPAQGAQSDALNLYSRAYGPLSPLRSLFFFSFFVIGSSPCRLGRPPVPLATVFALSHRSSFSELSFGQFKRQIDTTGAGEPLASK